jgi:hypothetical protein
MWCANAKPSGHVGRDGDDPLERVVCRERPPEEAEQLCQLLGKVVGREGLPGTSERQRGELIGPWRASEAQVDPARMQRLEQAERLGHLEGRVVGQHDPARADADPPGHARHVPDHHLGNRAGDARRVVVLRQPVARVAQLVGELGQVERVAERVPTRGA